MTAKSSLSENRIFHSGTLVFSTFLILALFYILMKSPLLNALQSEATSVLKFGGFSDGICDGALRPCLRIAHSVLISIVEEILHLVISPFFWDLTRSPLATPTPWPTKAIGPFVDQRLVPATAYFVYMFLCLSPIYLAARLLFKRPLVQFLFLGAAFGAIFGWHPLLVTVFFEFASLFTDHPRSYYLFDQQILAYDFAAMSLIMVTILYAALRRHKRWWEMAVLAALGQLTIEHVGFVIGLSLGVAALFEDDRLVGPPWIAMCKRLAITGVACIAVALPSFVAFKMMENAADYGGDKLWLTNNAHWWKSHLANYVTMVSLAMPGGAVVGYFAARGLTLENAHLMLLVGAAGAGVLIAYTFVFIAGFYFLAYPAEMGRQFMPLSIAVTVMMAGGVAAWVHRLRRN